MSVVSSCSSEGSTTSLFYLTHRPPTYSQEPLVSELVLPNYLDPRYLPGVRVKHQQFHASVPLSILNDILLVSDVDDEDGLVLGNRRKLNAPLISHIPCTHCQGTGRKTSDGQRCLVCLRDQQKRRGDFSRKPPAIVTLSPKAASKRIKQSLTLRERRIEEANEEHRVFQPAVPIMVQVESGPTTPTSRPAPLISKITCYKCRGKGLIEVSGKGLLPCSCRNKTQYL